MKTIIEKYVNDGQNSGLYLLPFPTGIGKSYQVVQFILDGLKKGTDNRRIFFLTSNRNNLPRTDLQVALGEEYSKFILEVRSFEDCIIENFEVSIIHSEFADDEVIQALKSAKDAYERAKERYEDESNKMLFVRNEPEIVKMKREEFLEAENNFRRYIRNHVVYELRDSLSKEGLNDEELQAQVVWHLKNNKKYQWIGKIYPNIFARDYKVIMMSMKKFLTINDCFFEPKYTFAKGDISSNSLIFIDEFDQTKDVLTDTIIEESLKNANDYLRLVETICYKVINYEQQLPHKVLRVIDENKRTFQRLYDEASEVFSKYKVYLKYYCHEAKGRNFLFNDFSYHSVFSTQGEKYAYVYENKENNNMTITLSKKSIEENSDKTDTDFDEFIQERELKDNMENPISGKEEVEVYSIYSVIRAFNHLLLSFKWFVQNIVPSYQEIDKAFKEKYKGASDIVDLLTDEHAVMSLYNCFGLSEREGLFLNTGYSFEAAKKKSKEEKRDLITKTNGFYDRGLKTYEFTNKYTRNEETSFSYIEINDSPESIIAHIATNAKVIGISATANIESVLSNYSLDYFRKKQDLNFCQIEKADFERIKEEYHTLNRKYRILNGEDGKIDVKVNCLQDVIPAESANLGKCIKAVFSNDAYARKVMKKFTTVVHNAKQGRTPFYHEKRYLSIAYVFKEFVLNENLRSFLCLTTATPKKGDNLDEDVLAFLFEQVLKENQVQINDNYYTILKSGSDFDNKKDELLSRLSNGEKIFVMAAYATLGAGQNLPYSPAQTDTDLINLTDFENPKDGRNDKKDFDGIYLGDVTNVVTNLYSKDGTFDASTLYHYLFEMENLYENEEIRRETLSAAIKAGFIKLSDASKEVPSVLGNGCTRSKAGYITKQAMQAVGRLGRTFNKRSEISIYISKSVFDFFDTEVVKKEIVSPEILAISSFIESRRGLLVYDENNNRAEHISFMSKCHIFETLSDDWNEARIEYWQQLRETVLKHPTASKKLYEKDEAMREYYICSKKQMNKYYFVEYHDFANVNVFFVDTKEDVLNSMKKQNNLRIDTYIKECSQENARLEELFQCEGVKEFFVEQGYATKFKKNDYMMCPILFQNIYKGALGEVVGKFILERELRTTLKELDTTIFEKFDFELCKDVYIDFKHWRRSSIRKTDYLNKIHRKLLSVNGKRAYIINLLDESNGKDCISKTFDGKIVEIPFLIHANDHTVNHEVIEMLMEELVNG